MKIKLKTRNKKIIDPVGNEVDAKIEEFELLGDGTMGPWGTLLVKIPDDWAGWNISQFHIKHFGVEVKYFGAHFGEVYNWWEVV